jgi:hypothetical protein
MGRSRYERVMSKEVILGRNKIFTSRYIVSHLILMQQARTIGGSIRL